MSDPDTDRARQLWCSVIALAIEDATANVDIKNERTSRILDKQQARRWLMEPNRDFNEVCHLAGLDPEAVRERTRRLIEKHDAAPAYAPRQHSKRYSAFGEERTISQWAKQLGVSNELIHGRLKQGWPVEEALTAPIKPRARKVEAAI